MAAMIPATQTITISHFILLKSCSACFLHIFEVSSLSGFALDTNQWNS